jgi:glycosyltransferase involved in cell wall biosynthesis
MIAIDASRTTVARVTGTEHYALQLIRAMIKLNDTHPITLYFRDAPRPHLFPPSPNVEHRVIPFRRAWTHLRFAAALWKDHPDVTFVPAHTLPFAFPGRAVVTVHDLGFRYFPEAHLTRDRLYLDWTTRYSARRAHTILADSEATKHDLTLFYGTPPEKIQVVYPGVEIAPPHDLQAVRTKYGLPEHYFLFIGTLQPRKNIARLVQAFARYRSQTGDDAVLVLAGGKGWLYDPRWVEGVEGVILPGYIDDADKSTLYQGAIATLFPSLYEGFGFPVIESMLCGTPVIGSNTSSVPELVRDAGLLVNPLSVDEITAAMVRIESEMGLRSRLREAGYAQAAKFTWEAAAQNLLQVLEQVGD